MIEVLLGDAEKIRLEPPGHLGEGAEFVLYRPQREFHQVKRQYGRDRVWSLKTLNSSKILPRFRERLLAVADAFDALRRAGFVWQIKTRKGPANTRSSARHRSLAPR
jgi:hypothetical protein